MHKKIPAQKKNPLINSCSGKRRYALRHEAEQVAADQMNFDLDVKLRVYKCPHCNNWHLTKDKVL